MLSTDDTQEKATSGDKDLPNHTSSPNGLTDAVAPVTATMIDPWGLGIGLLMNAIHDALIIVDPNTEQIVVWNKAAENIFGWTAEEAYERDINMIVPDEYKERHHAGMAKYLAGEPTHFVDTGKAAELPAITKTRHPIRIELTLGTLRPPDSPERRYVMAIVRDVTRKKRTEAMAMALLDSITEYGIAGEVILPELEAPEGLHNPHTPPSSPLSGRELEVLRHIAQGRQNESIAKELYMSLSTVKGHCTRIFRKLGVETRTEAALKAVKQGLLS